VLILCFCAQKSKKQLNKLQVVLRNLVKIKDLNKTQIELEIKDILFKINLRAKNLNKYLLNKYINNKK
jgi:hypothetical protein